MITFDAFLAKYKFTKEAFDETGLDWADLVGMAERHKKERSELVRVGKDTVARLKSSEKLHSVWDTVKKSEDLIDTVVRRKIQDPTQHFTSHTYDQLVHDLIAVRALYVCKDEWQKIHEFITETWELHGSPCAYYRNGDSETALKFHTDRGCRVVEHERGYRTVQYLIKTGATRVPRIVEIQVRTIFEEGWSEIDQLASTRGVHHPSLTPYLAMISRFASEADDLGAYIKSLAASLSSKERQVAELDRHRLAVTKALEDKIDALTCKDVEKENLRAEWGRLKTLETNRQHMLGQIDRLEPEKTVVEADKPASNLPPPTKGVKLILKGDRPPTDIPRPQPYQIKKAE